MPEVLRADNMDLVGRCFGLRYDANLVALYVEDDGYYYYFKCAFHKIWLKDLISLVERAIKDNSSYFSQEAK